MENPNVHDYLRASAFSWRQVVLPLRCEAAGTSALLQIISIGDSEWPAVSAKSNMWKGDRQDFFTIYKCELEEVEAPKIVLSGSKRNMIRVMCSVSRLRNHIVTGKSNYKVQPL